MEEMSFNAVHLQRLPTAAEEKKNVCCSNRYKYSAHSLHIVSVHLGGQCYSDSRSLSARGMKLFQNLCVCLCLVKAKNDFFGLSEGFFSFVYALCSLTHHPHPPRDLLSFL